MSKKQQRQLLLLLGALAAAVLILVCALLFSRCQAAQEEAGEVAISTGLSIDPTQLKWSGGTGTVELIRDESGRWYWAQDPDFPLEETLIQSITSALANPAQREIEIADSLEAYGLGDGALTLETVDAAGGSARLLIGGTFSDTDGEHCYAMAPDSGSILVLDTTLSGQLTETVYELADVTPMESLSENQVSDLSIQGSQETLLTVRSETVDDTTEYHWYRDGEDMTGSTLVSVLKQQLLSPSFSSLAYWKPDGATLEACGLGDPVTVTINYTDPDGNAASQRLDIGAVNEAGNSYYCTCDGGESVYLMSAASLADVMTVARDGFVSAGEAE